jgi:hypothetical protein
MSHPLMDFRCLNPQAVATIKQKLAKTSHLKEAARIEYYDNTHLQLRAKDMVENIKREGGFNSILGSVET